MPPYTEISIINKPSTFFFKKCARFYAKKILRSILRIQRGPDVVLKSLVRGLDTIDITYNINPHIKELYRIVHVLSNPSALEWAIEQKKLGKIDTLIAGPNISILPSFDTCIMSNSNIDMILLPSEWTREAFAKDSPSIAKKIQIWPSGVLIPQMDTMEKIDTEGLYLIYKKTFSDEMYTKIVQTLDTKSIPHKTLVYGTFKQAEYFELLTQARGMIYLQKSESQGIALQEAWARNVPTLVWDSKTYTYENTNITVSGKVSAPYLTDECGMFFDSLEEFDTKFTEFDNRIDSFTAREYCIKNLSDEASAQIYIKHIKSII